MPDTGFKLATAGASEAYAGSDIAWSNPGNVTASDNTYATVVLNSSNLQSEYVKASGFDFSAVPGGATINGVEVRVEVKASSAAAAHDFHAYIRVGGGGLSSDKGTGANIATSESQVGYGASNDLWGLSLAQSDLANLQVLYAVERVSGNVVVSVDSIDVRVTYTASGGGGTARSFGMIAG
jgi:hypothetical protein